MSRERKILSNPLAKPSIEKMVEKAFREVKESYRDVKDERPVKKTSFRKK